LSCLIAALEVLGFPSDFFCSWSPKLTTSHCVLFGFFFVLFSIADPRLARDFMAHCGRALLATFRLCENGFARCPEFTVHGFETSTSGVSAVLRHGCLHFRLSYFLFENYSSRSVIFRLNMFTFGQM